MYHKRLLKEFQDNIKYVVGMVATQWVSLIANVVLMLFIANIVATFVQGNASVWNDSAAVGLFIIFVVVQSINGYETFSDTCRFYHGSGLCLCQ